MPAKVQDATVDALRSLSLAHAAEIHRTSGRRSSAPIRSAFARDVSGQGAPPMATLVGMRGRGGEVPLKLLTALIWRSAASPFSTAISARKWAELLALPDPAHLGARRVTDALKTLEEQNLVAVEKRRGGMPWRSTRCERTSVAISGTSSTCPDNCGRATHTSPSRAISER